MNYSVIVNRFNIKFTVAAIIFYRFRFTCPARKRKAKVASYGTPYQTIFKH
jgi:hypothetical protein